MLGKYKLYYNETHSKKQTKQFRIIAASRRCPVISINFQDMQYMFYVLLL
jgi:hypothetical protein